MNKSVKFWDKRSSEYENNEKKYEEKYYKTVEKTKKFLNSNDKVLDFACGTGIITNQIADNVKEILAIDISLKMIEVAQRKANKRKIKNIQYMQTSIFDDKFIKESFDVILAFNIFHLVKNTEKVLKRINDLLKTGGLIISETPCMGHKKSLLSIILLLSSKIRLFPSINFLKFSELEGLVVQGNFQIIDSEKTTQSPSKMFFVAKKL